MLFVEKNPRELHRTFKLRKTINPNGHWDVVFLPCLFQWPWSPAVFLLFRTITCCYVNGISIYMLVGGAKGNIDYGRISLFLTVWAYILLCLHFLLTAIVAWYCYFRGRARTANETDTIDRLEGPDTVVSTPLSQTDSEPRIHVTTQSPGAKKYSSQYGIGISTAPHPSSGHVAWYLKISWILSDIVVVIALLVTIVYYGVIFPYTGYTSAPVISINLHGVNSLLVLLDVALSARPVRLLHFIYPQMFAAFYVAVTVIYWSIDPENNVVYPIILDWNSPGIPVGALFGLELVGIPLIHLVVFGLYKLRLIIFKKIYGSHIQFTTDEHRLNSILVDSQSD